MAAERYTIKQGDYGQAIPAICKDSAGAAVDISEAIEVRFHLGAEGSAATVDAVADNLDDGEVANRGKVSYTFQPGDSATAGDYRAEFEVTWATKRLTFPNDTYITVKVPDEVA